MIITFLSHRSIEQIPYKGVQLMTFSIKWKRKFRENIVDFLCFLVKQRKQQQQKHCIDAYRNENRKKYIKT